MLPSLMPIEEIGETRVVLGPFKVSKVIVFSCFRKLQNEFKTNIAPLRSL